MYKIIYNEFTASFATRYMTPRAITVVATAVRIFHCSTRHVEVFVMPTPKTSIPEHQQQSDIDPKYRFFNYTLPNTLPYHTPYEWHRMEARNVLYIYIYIGEKYTP